MQAVAVRKAVFTKPTRNSQLVFRAHARIERRKLPPVAASVASRAVEHVFRWVNGKRRVLVVMLRADEQMFFVGDAARLQLRSCRDFYSRHDAAVSRSWRYLAMYCACMLAYNLCSSATASGSASNSAVAMACRSSMLYSSSLTMHAPAGA